MDENFSRTGAQVEGLNTNQTREKTVSGQLNLSPN